jgi:glucokinase
LAREQVLSKRKRLVLALDIGGTHFRVALANEKGELLKQYKGRSHPEKGPDEAIESIIQSITEMLSDVGPGSVMGTGISIAGLVTPQTGVLLTSPNMLSWYNTPLKDIFERELQMSVAVGNDANLAVLGEHRFGAGVGSDHVIYMTVSTGIGGGVISGGKLITGSCGFAAELGHMTIDFNGPRCNCGSIGCLEIMASGTAIARMASERLSRGAVSNIANLVDGDLSKVTAEVVVKAAESGDTLAGEVMHTAASNLGVGLANYVHIFNPDIIALGGGVSQAGQLLFEPVRSVVAERIMPDYSVSIIPAALGDDSGLLGAAALVLGDYL